MQELIMSMLMNEHLAQMRADSDAQRHAATAKELRRDKRESRTEPQWNRQQEPYLGFLPRLINYPFTR